MADRVGQVVQQDVPTAAGADQVGVGDAYDIDPLGGECLDLLADLCRFLSAHWSLLGG
ncbi:hypothetical protein ABZ864_25440 [Streptomyces sp. NPDC047082]|uniref:hypothetical protein n=1 Tax=Streptomyces sp. NPDC047082 TaxID=3155259 RepID=UPI0033E7EF9B